MQRLDEPWNKYTPWWTSEVGEESEDDGEYSASEGASVEDLSEGEDEDRGEDQL